MNKLMLVKFTQHLYLECVEFFFPSVYCWPLAANSAALVEPTVVQKPNANMRCAALIACLLLLLLFFLNATRKW